jgi:hypothetical protein
MGNAIGAMHIVRGLRGPSFISMYENPRDLRMAI